MSGVNRNILKNSGIPVMAQDQIPMELVSNAGTRFVLLNWPVKTYISSSQGGDCEGITVQWTTDSSLASEPDSYYQALTSSVIPCISSSLIPLTSSLGWSVTIDSSYNTGSNTYYYLRSFQNSSGGGRGPYSNVLSLETRSPKLYGTDMYSTEYQYGIYAPPNQQASPGCTGSVLTFTVDSFVPQTGQLIAWSGDKFGAAVTMSVQSGSLQPMKAGGPNYDSIQTNGATMSFALTGSPSSSGNQTNSIQDGGYFNWGTTGGRQPYPDPNVSPYNAVIVGGVLVQPYSMRSYTTSVGLISGSLTIIGNSGYHVRYTATTSSQVNDICFIKDGIEYPGIPTGSNTKNKVIGTGGYGAGPKLNWYLSSGSGNVFVNVGTSSINIDPAISSIGSNVRIETSPDCVFRVISFGTLYNSDIYNQQYGTNI